MIWFFVAVLLLVSFMFSGIEAGILSVNRVRLQHRLKAGDKAALKLSRLLAHPQRMLGTVLLVTNLMNICAVILATQELVIWLGHFGYLVSFLLFLPLYVLGIELLPKSMFRRFPYRALAFFADVLRLTDLLLTPILGMGSLLAKVLVHRNETQNEKRKLFAGREEFKYLTIESEKLGTLGRTEREMIHNVVDFSSVKAGDVMAELGSVATIKTGSSVEEAAKIAQEMHTDLLPVVNTQREVIAVLSVYEALLDKHSQIGSSQRRVLTVPAEEPAYSVIRKLRAARLGLAAVVDHQGATIGVVRSEDLIRRLVTTATN